MDWKTMLAYVTGSVDENLLLRIEYLVAENRILRGQIKDRLQLSDAERQTLAEIGKKLGKQALEEVANIVKPDTLLGWHRKLVANKFDGSEQRKSLGRPRVDKELEDLVVQMAKENRSWGYDRIAGALAHLGYEISDQTVGNILKRRGLPIAPDRQKITTWKDFISRHMDVLWATDFFSTEVWTLGGLVTFYVLFLVVYPCATDNSRVGEFGKIVSFHHCERSGHDGPESIVLPAPIGRSGIDLYHHPCLVAQRSEPHTPTTPQTGQAPSQALQRTQAVHRPDS